MCGRARSTARPSEIRNILNRILNDQESAPVLINEDTIVNNADNITPGMCMHVAYMDNDNNICVDIMTWGIKMSNMTLFNTRSEDLSEKPKFCKMMKDNRGVVILDGFYEYISNGRGKPKSKILITPADNKHFIIPVIFNNKKSFTILTQSPVTETYSTIHDRQPVIFSNTQLYYWIVTHKHHDQFDNIKNIDVSINTFNMISVL